MTQAQKILEMIEVVDPSDRDWETAQFVVGEQIMSIGEFLFVLLTGVLVWAFLVSLRFWLDE